ncbi:MAG: tetratricopeptide repeat protein, partial [Deltaproteobacteria bacterium]|nr:tetratricopeptide repeat protein [Deltaproteobacteria bacterium]
LIYFNTLDASWHFDDEPNILNNRGLHIHNLKPESLVRTFFTSPTAGGSISDSLYRPIPCLTFAINWYFGKGDVFGYHLVNIAVHILTTYLIYLTILNLLKAPKLQHRYNRKENFIAFLAAALWAIHPIQTQAVTYIVQRMASMAAMFYILGIYFYVKTRQSRISARRIGLLFGCAISFIFAIGSKQNAAALPFALLLIEIIGFQDLNRPGVRKAFWVGSIVGGLLLVALSVWLFLPGGSETLISGYDQRPFSLSERLLTEPRIVLFYLSLIFYPDPNRLSIEHDIQLSTSLIEPWTTLPAILTTIILIAIGISQYKKRPLLALAILFFYLNHVIESTFIPLELIFEHRNYLPSFFLFLPVAAGFNRLLDYYKEKNRAFRSVLIAFLVLFMIGIGAGSYIRNMAWATEKTLWEDAMQKAPNSHRPLHNLASYHYERIGQLDKALELYQKSLELRTNNNFANPSAMSNMALIYVRQNEYEKAIALWDKILSNKPVYGVHQYLYVIGSIEMKDWNRALTGINRLIEERPTDFNYNYLKGYVLLNLKDYRQALRYFERCLKLIADNHQALVGAGVCYSLLGQYQSAEDIFKTAHRYYPDNDLVLLWLVDTKLKQNERRAADRYLSRLLKITPVEELLESLEKNNTKHFLPPDSKTLILDMVKSAEDKKLDNIAG